MSLKPIQKVVKMWAVTCSITIQLLQFEVYLDNEGDSDVSLEDMETFRNKL